jgi:hypothetical protein
MPLCKEPGEYDSERIAVNLRQTEGAELPAAAV